MITKAHRYCCATTVLCWRRNMSPRGSLRASGNEIRLLELDRHELDADKYQARSHRVLVAGPTQVEAVRQASRSSHRPIGMIAPVSSASGMNCVRREQPALGCCQRISASSPVIVARREIDDRLVVDHELVAVERLLQIALELEPLEICGSHPAQRRTRTGPCHRPWRGTSRCRRRGAGPARAGGRARCRCWPS